MCLSLVASWDYKFVFCSCAKYTLIKSFFVDNCQIMCKATIQVWNMTKWNLLPLQKGKLQ